MGKLHAALKSWRRNAFYAKEGDNTLIREEAKRKLAVDFQNMIAALDEPFDEEDEKAWQWLKDNE